MHRDREITQRQPGSKAGRQADINRDRRTDINSERNRQTGRQASRHKQRKRERKKGRERDRKKERELLLVQDARGGVLAHLFWCQSRAVLTSTHSDRESRALLHFNPSSQFKLLDLPSGASPQALEICS